MGTVISHGDLILALLTLAKNKPARPALHGNVNCPAMFRFRFRSDSIAAPSQEPFVPSSSHSKIYFQNPRELSYLRTVAKSMVYTPVTGVGGGQNYKMSSPTLILRKDSRNKMNCGRQKNTRTEQAWRGVPNWFWTEYFRMTMMLPIYLSHPTAAGPMHFCV